MVKRSFEEVRKIVKDLGYELLDEYPSENRGRIRRVIIQDDDGYRYDVQLSNLMNGQIPPIAETRNSFSLTNISLWLKIENKPFKLCENNIYKAAHEKLFFQCLQEECQEVFDISWDHVYSRGSGCLFCIGKRVGKRNNLAYRRPDLAKEWDYKKNEENPENYTCGSHKKVFWICSECGHSWDAQINNRSSGRGCSNCSDVRKESKIANNLKKILKEKYDAKDEYKVLKNPNTNYWLPYDIYIPYGKNYDLNGFYIEVHWEQHYKICLWHKKLAERNLTTPEEEFEYQKHLDRFKRRFAKKNGIYIEIDIRKIKTTEQAIEYIENIMKKTLSN